MTKLCFFIAFLMLVVPSTAQFYENFSDRDFTSGPEWITQSGNFIVNTDFQLQSSNNNTNQTFQIYTESQTAQNAQWEFWVRLDFNTSSANYVDVWLMSSATELSDGNNEGYFVRLGSADDNITLYRKTSGTNAVAIITGQKGLFNASSSTLKIKVIRTPENKWILLRDITGTGNYYRSVGVTTDDTIDTSEYFGISIRQSTASFFGKHYFDDFEVKTADPIPESLEVVAIRAINTHSIELDFSNPLDIESAENSFHYHINALGTPQQAGVDPADGSIVVLIFANEIKPNTPYNIIIDGVADVFGNKISDHSASFTFFKPSRYDVVINEVFADPAPSVGLPGQKFIELRNNTSSEINLNGWQLRSGNATAILPSANIPSQGFLIITAISGRDAYVSYGDVASVSGFPTLNIGGSEVALYDADGALIHAMRYDLSTYGNEVKKDGGFTLELINPMNGCAIENNWAASNDKSGGTPGRENSVHSSESNSRELILSDVYFTANDTLIVKINTTVDSTSAVNTASYQLTPQLTIKSKEALPPYFEKIKLTLNGAADENTLYSITIQGLSDCNGNDIKTQNTKHFGIFSDPAPGDIVINEVLSNPATSGGEYVELYNRSNSVIDISQLHLGNRNSAGEVASITRMATESRSLLPGEFLILTKNQQILINDYPLTNTSAIWLVSTMPSYPNDNGFIVLLDYQGNIIDEVDYEKSWHFQLINDTKGIALERIDVDGPSEASNFHSAAADVGYGTPGYKNSQNRNNSENDNLTVIITPEVFSPDNDGLDDFLTIQYNFESPGYITNIKIFDASGRMVRYLEKNSVSGTKGYYRWDGLDEKNQKLPQGIYLVYFESFNEEGKKIIHRKAVTLARRL